MLSTRCEIDDRKIRLGFSDLGDESQNMRRFLNKSGRGATMMEGTLVLIRISQADIGQSFKVVYVLLVLPKQARLKRYND